MSSESNESKIKVKEVCKNFLLKSDEILADKLQYDEHIERYNQNRKLKLAHRQNIQESLPVVKQIQSTEYGQLLEASQRRLKELQEIEDNDARIANQLQQEYLKELENEKLAQQLRDQQLASKLQEDEIFRDKHEIPPKSRRKPEINANSSKILDDDEHFARELQERERIEYAQSLNKTSTTCQGEKDNQIYSNERIQPKFKSSVCKLRKPIVLEPSQFEQKNLSDGNSLVKEKQEKLIINFKFDSLSSSSLSSSTSSLVKLENTDCLAVPKSKSISHVLNETYTTRENISELKKHSSGENIYNSIETRTDSSKESLEETAEMNNGRAVLMCTNNATTNFERESLIKSICSSYNKKSDFSTLSKEHDLLTDMSDTNNLTMGSKNRNIVATIDPTYKSKYKFSYLEDDFGEKCDLEEVKNKSIKDSKAVVNVNEVKYKNGNNSFIFENDTEIFLPIQGQKRNSFKSLNLNKKKSQSTCLQQ